MDLICLRTARPIEIADDVETSEAEWLGIVRLAAQRVDQSHEGPSGDAPKQALGTISYRIEASLQVSDTYMSKGDAIAKGLKGSLVVEYPIDRDGR
ncbi:MAG: hypothetical protein WBM96_15320, partial [Polyangiales bacterium]